MKIPLYQKLAQLVDARLDCIAKGNPEWRANHEATIAELCKKLPSGNGFHVFTTLDLSRSRVEKLVFCTSFHHMDKNGFYDGWTDHDVTVTASLAYGYTCAISGKDRNSIKELIHDYFSMYLEELVDI